MPSRWEVSKRNHGSATCQCYSNIKLKIWLQTDPFLQNCVLCLRNGQICQLSGLAISNIFIGNQHQLIIKDLSYEHMMTTKEVLSHLKYTIIVYFHHLSWNICVDIGTDGTKAMVGKINGALQQNKLVITVFFITTHLQRKRKKRRGEKPVSLKES